MAKQGPTLADLLYDNGEFVDNLFKEYPRAIRNKPGNIWGQFPNNHGMTFRPYWIELDKSPYLTNEEINKYCPWYWDYKI